MRQKSAVMMPESLEHRVALIRSLPIRPRRAAIDTALAAASDPEEIERLAIELLELSVRPGVKTKAGPWARRGAYRRQLDADIALSLLCSHWGSLSPAARLHTLGVANGRWTGVIRDLVQHEHTNARLALCGMALASGEPALYEPVGELLEDEEASIHRAAGVTLLSLVALELELDPATLAPDLGPIDQQCLIPDAEVQPRQALLSVLRSAITRYGEHQQRSIALACLLLIAHDSHAHALASNRVDHAATQALRGVLRWSRAPITRVCALRLLGHDALSDAAVNRLSRAHDLADHDLTLRQGHLTLNPTRHAHLGKIEVRARSTTLAPDADGTERLRITLPKECPLPDGSWLSALSPQARRQIPRWVAAFDTDELATRALLDPLLGDDDELTRLMASRGANARTTTDFCFDACEPIARGAMTRFSFHAAAQDPTTPTHRRQMDTLSKLVRSPHASVRRMAREDLTRLDPWASDSSQTSLIARRRMADEPEAFLVDLRHVLMSGSALTRIRAIGIARRLGITDQIESLLLSLVTQSHGPNVDERVVASSVSALGSLCTPNARQTVRMVLRHPDPRARANAVEAMSKQERLAGLTDEDNSLRSTLTELRGDSHQRVRANAVHALMALPEPKGGAALYTPSASSALIAMLRDERAPHRVSGLWVAERSAVTHGSALVSHVQSLAEMDPDRGVRNRAHGLIHRIEVRQRLQSTKLTVTADNSRASAGQP